MGYPYHELIPPAILLDNPGLTKEEYIEALDKTHGSGYTEFKQTDPWDSHDDQERDFHDGSRGLSGVLNLGYSEKFKVFQTPTLDENGLPIDPVKWYPRMEQDYESYEFVTTHEVTRHLGNQVGQPQILEIKSWEQLQEGKYLAEQTGERVDDFFEDALIQKVLQVKHLKRGDLSYRLRVLPFTKLTEMETFDSEEAVYQKWPQFHPDEKYNFIQPRGHFRLSHDLSGDHNFLWLFKDGRYFLDPETFNRIPASWKASDWECLGYTDLIATAEAIKHQAWKLLSRRGLDHFDAFLRDFPDARVRLERAIRDSHLSLASKKHSETINELLRMRLTNSST